MAITETRPATADASEVHTNPWDTGDEYPSFATALGSGDHKTVGRLFIGFALLFGIASLVLAGLSSLNDLTDVNLFAADTSLQVFTVSRVGLVFGFAVPLLLGLGVCLVPLQVGARTVAFPRAAAAGFWGWLAGSVLVIVGYGVDGGIGGDSPKGVDLTYMGLGVAIVGLLLTTICVMTTIVALRPTGMRIRHVPFFSWSMLVAGSMWLVSLPVLLGNLLLIYVDHRYGRPSEFGVQALQWNQLYWAFSQPQVFAYAVPVLGIVTDAVATMSGVRMRNRGVMLVGIGAFGILSFGAWAQDHWNEDVWHQWLYVGMGIAIVLPLLLVFAGWAATMRNGKPRITTASIGALGAALVLLLAVAASVLYVVRWFKLAETGYFESGLLVLVVGAVVVGGIAGAHYWAPKISGHLANEGIGRLTALIGVLGAIVAGLALCVSGFQKRWDGLADAANTLNAVAAGGLGLLALALLLTAFNLLGARRGAPAGDDPWQGQTLEWATASPPLNANFGELPVISSPEPLLDLAEGGNDPATAEEVR